MSILSFPRIILNGTTSWNPATNNNALDFGYDKDPVKVKLPAGQTYETYDQWLVELNAQGKTNGDWNVFGQMESWFNARVVNALTDSPSPLAVDPVIGGALRMTGGTAKLVDIDPYSSVTSQVFLKDFGVEADSDIGFSGPAACRMTSRRPFFGRNIRSKNLPIAGGMGVIWQTTIAKEQIQWASGNSASEVLTALRKEMENSSVQGLMMRVATYTTVYFTSVVSGGWIDQPAKDVYGALARIYRENTPITVGNVASVFNPAVSTLTGAIGLWQEGELKSVPTGRIMQASKPQPGAKSVQLGPAAAQINPAQGVVSLDMLNTVPESDEYNTKANVGTFTLKAVLPNGQSVKVGKLPYSAYNKSAYQKNGGIADIAFSGDPDQLAQSSFFLIPEAKTTSRLSALPLWAETDDRGIYLDENDSKTITVQVYPVDAIKGNSILLRVISNDRSTVLKGGMGTDYDQVFTVGAQGKVVIGVTAYQPGNSLILFEPFFPGQTPDIPSSPSPTTGYSAVRVLPFNDDLAQIPQDQLTWELVYEQALRPFDLSYRGMSSGVFQLGSETSVRSHANAIEGFTSPEEFESPSYMPVTRDLSRGRRDLLLRFLKSQGPGVA